MDEINEKKSFITCSCGERFQVLGPFQRDSEGELVQEWNEQATVEQYEAHRGDTGH